MHVLFRIKYGFAGLITKSPDEYQRLLGPPHCQTKMMKF